MSHIEHFCQVFLSVDENFVWERNISSETLAAFFFFLSFTPNHTVRHCDKSVPWYLRGANDNSLISQPYSICQKKKNFIAVFCPPWNLWTSMWTNEWINWFDFVSRNSQRAKNSSGYFERFVSYMANYRYSPCQLYGDSYWLLLPRLFTFHCDISFAALFCFRTSGRSVVSLLPIEI